MARLFTVGYFTFALLTWPDLSVAAGRSVTLSVERMVCSTCAYRVRTALQSVSGVKQVTVSIADKSAVVVHEDTQADVTALMAATTKVGFPAVVKK